MEHPIDSVERSETDWFAQYYAEHRYNPLGFRLRFERDLEVLLRRSGRSHFDRVLSVGCGEGTFELLLAPYAEEVVGLDLTPQAVQAAQANADRRNIRNVTFDCAHYRELDFDPASFDLVVCLAFLHHVPEDDLLDFLEDMLSLLKPGGLMYSQDPNKHGLFRRIGRVVMGSHYHTYHSPDERELDPVHTERLYQDAGYSRIDKSYWDFCLIPMSFVLAGRPSWPLYLCRTLDWLLCRTPLRTQASGFTILAQR